MGIKRRRRDCCNLCKVSNKQDEERIEEGNSGDFLNLDKRKSIEPEPEPEPGKRRPASFGLFDLERVQRVK